MLHSRWDLNIIRTEGCLIKWLRKSEHSWNDLNITICKWKKDTNLSLNQENNHADCLVPCDQVLNFSKLEMLLIQYMQCKYPRTTFEASVPSEKNILSSTSFFLENTILVTSLFKVYLSKRCRWVCSRNCKFRFRSNFFFYFWEFRHQKIQNVDWNQSIWSR